MVIMNKSRRKLTPAIEIAKLKCCGLKTVYSISLGYTSPMKRADELMLEVRSQK